MIEFFVATGEGIVTFFGQAWAVILNFRIVDLIDILFVAFMIYGVLRLIREMRGVQLLKGLFWLAIVAGVSELLSMQASRFIFRQAMNNAIVLLVILFQPEIRAVFERLGRNPIANLKFLTQPNRAELVREEVEAAIHGVCEACRKFCAENTGALIVFERVTMLGDVIQTGTVIDSKVSLALLGNIFHNKAPLHDGAVIIRKGRMEAAGCILPLPQNPEMEHMLGTRHRAAIGMSEQSDAAVAVVSEETGHLSLAYKGVLQWGISPEELGEFLRAKLVEQESIAPKRFKLGGRKKGETQ